MKNNLKIMAFLVGVSSLTVLPLLYSRHAPLTNRDGFAKDPRIEVSDNMLRPLPGDRSYYVETLAAATPLAERLDEGTKTNPTDDAPEVTVHVQVRTVTTAWRSVSVVEESLPSKWWHILEDWLQRLVPFK